VQNLVRRSSNVLIQLHCGNSGGTLTEFRLCFKHPMLPLFWRPIFLNHATPASQAPITHSPLGGRLIHLQEITECENLEDTGQARRIFSKHQQTYSQHKGGCFSITGPNSTTELPRPFQHPAPCIKEAEKLPGSPHPPLYPVIAP